MRMMMMVGDCEEGGAFNVRWSLSYSNLPLPALCD
jgi:hypothetical protein